MAANHGLQNDDEESLYSKVLPVTSTPTSEDCKDEDDGKTQKPPTTGVRLGLEEICSLEVWRASLAEILGTATLVFAIDTAVISTFETNTTTPTIVVGLYITFILAILLIAVFPVSGGHINPLISFVAALLGFVSVTRAIIYTVAQCIGSVLGALALKAVISSQIQNTYSLGGCTLTIVAPGTNGPITTGIATAPGLWLEIFSTFVLLFTVVQIAFDPQQFQARGPVISFSMVGIIVGILAFMSATLTTSKGYAGAGMNPARCFGPAVVRGGLLWERHWIFWAGPAIAVVSYYIYLRAIPPKPQA